MAHVNYRLRGRDADRDEELVRERAREYRQAVSVCRPRTAKKGNLEENLRERRYDYFEKLRQEKKFDLIAVAHNQDDQAETLLLRLLRGAGFQGLAAMRPRQERVIRPLLATSRAEIMHYCKARALPFREDATNRDPRFLRNRVRHRLLPYLEKNFEPRIKKILAETAALLARDYALLTSLPKRLVIRRQKTGQEFSLGQALGLPEASLPHELPKFFFDFLFVAFVFIRIFVSGL